MTVNGNIDLQANMSSDNQYLEIVHGFRGNGFFSTSGAGRIHAWASNTDYTGDFCISNQQFIAQGTKIFGTSSNRVDIYIFKKTDPPAFQLRNKETFENTHFHFHQLADASNSQMMGAYIAEGNIFKKRVYVSMDREFRFYQKPCFAGGLTVHKPTKSGFAVFAGDMQFPAGSGTIEIDGPYYTDGGESRIAQPLYADTTRFGTIICGADNLFENAGVFSLGFNYFNGGTNCNSALHLNGYNQKIVGLETAHQSDKPTYPNIFVTSSSPARLEIFDNEDRTYKGRLNGPIEIIKSGSGTWTLTAAGNLLTGSMHAHDGTIIIEETATFPAINNLTATGSGSITIKTPDINPHLDTVIIGTNASLFLADPIKITTKSATINGQPLKRGNYTKADFPTSLLGEGTIQVLLDAPTVPEKTFHWTGQGKDQSLETAENWLENEAPGFTNGTDILIFPSAEKLTATVSRPIHVHTITITTTNDFSLTSADPSATLTLHGGFYTRRDDTDMSTKRTEIIDIPILLPACNQQWDIATNTTLRLVQKISGGTTNATILQCGYGQLSLCGDNQDWMSQLISSNGTVSVEHGWALGSDKREVILYCFPGTSQHVQNYNYLYFNTPEQHITNHTPVAWYGQPNHIVPGSATVTFLKPLRRLDEDPYTGDILFRVNGTLNLQGGVLAKGKNILFGGGGTINFSGEPINLQGESSLGNFDLCEGNRTIASQGNICKNFIIRQKMVTLLTNDIFYADQAPELLLGIHYSTERTILNLNGYDLFISRFSSNRQLTENYFTEITSTDPAFLRVNGNKSIPWQSQIKFTGAAGLLQTGTGTNRLDSCQSTSTGPLIIQAGQIVFKSNAGWIGSTNITLSGTGSLRIENPTSDIAFHAEGMPANTTLTVNDAATISIPESGVETVRYLFKDGHPQPRGDYTAANSTFVKSGTLRVLASAYSGFLLMIH